MKRIFKRTLFIFMSILLAQSYHVQASAAAAPIVTGFFRTCGQKMGAAAMKNVIKPAFVLTRAVAVTTAGAFGLYKGGELLLEKGTIPVPAPAPILKVEASQGAFGNLFPNWNWGANTPKAITTNAGEKVTEKALDWGPWISSMVGLDFLKNSSLGNFVKEYPTASKVALGYFAAGYAYIHIVKRIQLNTIHKKFFIGIDAAQNNRPNDSIWIECQNILRNSGRGYQANPTVQNAFDYINSLSASDINNGWADWAFGAHVLWSRALRNDKMLWVF